VYFEGLFRFRQFADFSTPVIFAGGLLIVLDAGQTWCKSHTWLTDRQDLRVLRYTVVQLLLVSVFAAAIAHTGTITPFIYFQF
jgi:ABC-type cobalamin transport system permease subunit